jgi:hypothetical protein
VNDYEKTEKAAAAGEAAEAVVHRPQGSRAVDIKAGMIRYLAAEAYREKVEETRASHKDVSGTPKHS